MRTITAALFLLLLTVLAFRADAQVANFSVNGSGTGFTLASGGQISWEYDLPAGDTVSTEIWIDINMNALIDPATDRLYLSFLQADGVMGGLDGPPDIDGSVNGHVAFAGNVGLAPGMFVMRVSNHGTSVQVPGTVTPLASPAHTVSGKVTVPAGQSAQYLLIEANRDGYEVSFWHALTDANGDFVIQMDADTAGGPWHVRLNHPYRSAVVSPDERWIYPGSNPSGIDFAIEFASAKVAGVVVNESGNALPEWQIFLNRNDHGIFRYQQTDLNGTYEIGALGVELNGQTWSIQSNEEGDARSNTTMMAQQQLPALQEGDSLYRRLVIYSINSQIQGQVRINGFAPGFPVQLVASNSDTAQNGGEADGASGAFSIGVSDRIANYELFPINLGPAYNGHQVLVHPGQTGILLDITTTSVEDPSSTTPELFALEQNYPNPFNPSTTIGYSLPARSFVQLKVYNLLGQEVATLANETLNAGRYSVRFDASQVPSGFYLYKLTAGNFIATKAMVVMK